MKALISPMESFSVSWVSSWAQENTKWVSTVSTINDCFRVAQVEADADVFEVAEPLFWTACPEDCVRDEWYFKEGQCVARPVDVPSPTTPVESMP